MVERFDRLYRRFRTANVPDGAPAYLLLTNPHVFGRPAFLADERPRCLDDPQLLFEYAHTYVLNCVTAAARHHLLIHAAALSLDQTGIILAGASGYGKTTLTVELLRRGAHFLSDDLAAIDARSSTLIPFPRSLGIRPATDRPSLNSESRQRGTPGVAAIPTQGQTWVDVEVLFPGQLSPPCPPRVLICLVTSEASPDGSRHAPWGTAKYGSAAGSLTSSGHRPVRDSGAGSGPALHATVHSPSGPAELYLTVDCTPRAWVDALRTLSQIKNLSTADDHRLPVVRLSLRAMAGVEPRIEELCRQYDVTLFDVSRRPGGPPDFDVPPSLTPIGPWEATLALLHHLRGGAQAALVRHGFQGSMPRLALFLARLTSQMACFRLRVGRLHETADLVGRAIEESAQ